MNFKRPCWLALFVSLGMMGFGFCGFLSTHWDPKGSESSWSNLIGIVTFLMTYFGVLGFVVSLIWWIVAAIISSIRSHRPKSRF
jgi:hypothetical protein